MNVLCIPTDMVQLCYTPPPLGALYLAAMDPDTVIYDAALKGVPPDAFIQTERPRVVGCSMYTSGRHEALRILKVAKECGAITVAGGPHVALMHEQLEAHYPWVDYWIGADGEAYWQQICRYNHLEPGYYRGRIDDLDNLPLPAWERIDINAYPARPSTACMHRGNDLTRLPRVSIVLGRGCDGACTFCSTHWINGKYHAHGRSWMAAQLSLLWELGVRHLVFQDDCLTADREKVLGLCQALEPYTFSWFGCTRVDHLDLELARRMQEVGCYELSFGIENGSPTILKKMNKRVNLEQAFVARDICKQAGIYFTALYVDGFPGETPQTRAEDAAFRQRLQPDSSGGVGHTMVFPGTAVYNWCKRAGLLSDDFWLGPEPYYVYHGGIRDEILSGSE